MQLFVNDLTVIDCAYLCPQRGMVGESWLVDVILSGGLDAQNMVLDFAKVKRTIKQTIDEICDHRLLIPAQYKGVQINQGADDRLHVSFASTKGDIYLACPNQAFGIIPCETISSKAIVDYIQAHLLTVLPDNIDSVSLSLRTEIINGAYYQYSHGLKRHDGNCQRIAHGHRSKIEIFCDGNSSPELATHWANQWQDIYLAAKEDQISISDINLFETSKIMATSHYAFGYQAPQGRFELALPMAICDILPCDTTVELLAEYIAHALSQANAGKSFKVFAYEGVGKGAIATGIS